MELAVIEKPECISTEMRVTEVQVTETRTTETQYISQPLSNICTLWDITHFV